MSANNGGGWKPSKREPFICKDGLIVYVQRPGPHLALRVSRIPRTFSKSLDDTDDDQTPEGVLELMSEAEQESTVAIAREIVAAMVVEPKLYLNPKEGQLSPDDTGVDFWPLFSYAMTNYYHIKVSVGDEEVEVEDLETFRAEPGVQGDGVDGVHIPIGEAESDLSNQGLVDGAGA